MNPSIPPDFVGYENLINFLQQRNIHQLAGDLVEIGAFMGGGTVKLAGYAGKHNRKVYVVDVFEPALDQTVSRGGMTAQTVYEAFLEGRSMWEVYQEATRDFNNIVTIHQDSKKVSFREQQQFIFGFIDGCHEESYVYSDFHLIWPHLVSGGVLGFHDFDYPDWEGVTRAVNLILAEYGDEIEETVEIPGVYDIRSLMLIKKPVISGGTTQLPHR